MKKTCSLFNHSIRWMGLLSMLCLWASCSSPKLAQKASTSNNHLYMAQSDEAPQAAQTQSASTNGLLSDEEVELIASTDPAIQPAVTEKLDASLAKLTVENPKLARKMAKVVHQLEMQASVKAEDQLLQANTTEKNAAKKLLAKAEKKFDILKAEKAEAAQANTTLVALGALLAIVGLVLVLASSGTAATVGLISLVIGVVLLIISLFS